MVLRELVFLDGGPSCGAGPTVTPWDPGQCGGARGSLLRAGEGLHPAGGTPMVAQPSPPRALHLVVSEHVHSSRWVGRDAGRERLAHLGARAARSTAPEKPCSTHALFSPWPPALMPACRRGLGRCRRAREMRCHPAPLGVLCSLPCPARVPAAGSPASRPAPTPAQGRSAGPSKRAQRTPR